MFRTVARILGLGLVTAAMTVAPAFASGGSGGGGGTATCGGLTLAVGGYVPNPAIAGTAYTVQASGKTSNCLPLNNTLAIRFDDTLTGSCALASWTFIPATYNAYGAKMIDNYRSNTTYIAQAGCAIEPHTFNATLYVRSTNAVLSKATAVWDPSVVVPLT
jgi:hypothetical protein